MFQQLSKLLLILLLFSCNTTKKVDKNTSTVTLVGTASDEDGTIVKTYWEQVSGPSVIMKTPFSLITLVIVNNDGIVREFRLTAIDNQGAATSDTMRLTPKK